MERLDNLSFTLKLANGSVRSIGAPCVQTLMDWMTAIAVAAEAYIVEPTSDLSLVDQSRTTHIILVRHGHYASSQTPSVDMHGPLTDLGVQQARATGKFLHNYLSERMVLKRFPKFPVYHSGVRRAVETAQHIGNAFPSGSVQLRENKLFREAWPGNPLPNGNRQQLAREKLDNMVSDCARLKMAYRTTFRHLIPQDLEIEERELSEEDKSCTPTRSACARRRLVPGTDSASWCATLTSSAGLSARRWASTRTARGAACATTTAVSRPWTSTASAMCSSPT